MYAHPKLNKYSDEGYMLVYTGHSRSNATLENNKPHNDNLTETDKQG